MVLYGNGYNIPRALSSIEQWSASILLLGIGGASDRARCPYSTRWFDIQTSINEGSTNE